MSNKVQILPSDVIAKIAAGEVIDRPSSVVKECMENSLDAGATKIEVHLKDAGKQLIHIKDNGCGISQEDLQNLFQRHATSKIKEIDDLQTLNSLGFRGEALFSIGSIADVVIKSQPTALAHTQTPNAWQLHVRGGKRLSLEPAAPSGNGTELKISELFFNTPARKKFLKSNTTELNQIIDTFTPYTLLYPAIHFQLTHVGRTIFDLKPVNSLKKRAAQTLNLKEDDLLEVDQEFKETGIRLRMVLGNINIQRTRRDLQYFFINNRPIDHRTLGFHVNDIYKLLLPPSIYGCFIIYIDLNPATIDVNIHPTKREVKIENEGKLVSLIRQTVEYTLMSHGGMRRIEAPVARPEASTQAPSFFTHEPLSVATPAAIYNPGDNQGRLNPASYSAPAQSLSASLPLESVATEMDAHLFQKPAESLRDKFARAHYIGSFKNKYLLWQVDDSLILVDQHAAQERIMFEKFKNQIDQGQIEVQHLLTPIVLKLTAQEHNSWEEIQETLKHAGIETTAFDQDAVAIQTVPVLVKNPEQLLRTLLSGDKGERCDHLTIARRACKASIVSGDCLRPDEALYQRKQLLACHDPFICPHGRPTAIEITDQFLERQFLRS